MPASCEEILEAYRVPAPPGCDTGWPVYQVGCLSQPLNFASQQMRAFALMWALDTQTKSPNWLRDKRVAIIGGGFAGVTAGIVALLRGAKHVSLYERSDEMIPLQHGATRDVRPFIFRWPKGKATDSLVKRNRKDWFPLLHWKSGTADEVRKTVLDQAQDLYERCAKKRLPTGTVEKTIRDEKRLIPKWQDCAKHDFLRQRLGTEVRVVTQDRPGGPIRVLAEGREPKYIDERDEWLPVGPIRNFDDVYDVVIAAVGFGLERTESGIPFRSYWHTDSLAQPIFTGRTPWRVLISGTGDGGLTDAIRARLFDVDLKLVIDVLTGIVPPEAEQRRPRKGIKQLIHWNEWKGQCKTLREHLEKIEDKGKKVPKAEFSEFMEREYEALCVRKNPDTGTPQHPCREAIETLKAFFRSRERTDTLVYLRGTEPTPYSKNGSAMFRFIVFLLRKYCSLRYRQGQDIRFPEVAPDPHKPFSVALVNGGEVTESITVDEAYIRHGAVPALEKLFGKGICNAIRDNPLIPKIEEKLWAVSDKSWRTWGGELEARTIAPKKSPVATS